MCVAIKRLPIGHYNELIEESLRSRDISGFESDPCNIQRGG